MSKGLTNEIMAILRLYEIADEESSKRAIIQTKELHPTLTSRLLTFTYGRTKYYALFDGNADDNEAYILKEMSFDQDELKGKLLHNPHDETATFGMRFQGKEMYLFQVDSIKRRLDVELADRFPELSRSTIQKYIKAGLVTVNAEVSTVPKAEVNRTDEIAMLPPEPTDFSKEELPILYIDDSVIVINKPAGVLTHSKGAMNDEFTVADFFRRYTTNGLETSRPGIVHRLDRDTSGVMIGARNDETALLLKEQFSQRKVKKEYIAVVDGVPKVANAIIDLPIGRSPSAPSTFKVDPSGKEAKTTYEVLASNSTDSLVMLWPKTGRTHQLRVHMQYINTPIKGDRIYGRVGSSDRLYLHAHSLEITIPISKRQTFIAPTPKEFTKHFPGMKDV